MLTLFLSNAVPAFSAHERLIHCRWLTAGWRGVKFCWSTTCTLKL